MRRGSTRLWRAPSRTSVAFLRRVAVWLLRFQRRPGFYVIALGDWKDAKARYVAFIDAARSLDCRNADEAVTPRMHLDDHTQGPSGTRGDVVHHYDDRIQF